MAQNVISTKRMEEVYVRHSLDSEVWEMLYRMACTGLLSMETWIKFYKKCGDYVHDEKGNVVDAIDGHMIYQKNEDGFLVKV